MHLLKKFRNLRSSFPILFINNKNVNYRTYLNPFYTYVRIYEDT